MFYKQHKYDRWPGAVMILSYLAQFVSESEIGPEGFMQLVGNV